MKNYKDLSLIIISSDNIDEIKEELDKIEEIKNLYQKPADG